MSITQVLASESVTRHALLYQSGFNNEITLETLKGALPEGRNSPRSAAPMACIGNSSAAQRLLRFGQTRDKRRSWLYRTRPSAMHTSFEHISAGRSVSDFSAMPAPPNPLR